ncbi:ABC transporter substrate-binding protein [Geomonas oryzisoli]|uniref:ABC transporter substrate-binding protein n=1 Tax=Geomonas oryzisoli TaxID=2847992 RepID=A0ABX8J7P6_9BACT|nr:ABC transporter substrate-binding protein [Geomonas oryzisoli]QWV93362.1 ABC transporter substrate-binding protein [Geomonas oryzisoli]
MQPLAYPVGAIGSVLARDAVLKRDLSESGYLLRVVPFRKGTEMVDRMGGDLSAAIVGDMPVILMALRADVRVVGLAKKTFTSLVGRNITLLSQLKGKRVAYMDGSSAHHTLLQALSSAGLSERDVTLVQADLDAMPGLLEGGKVDAFAAWEPAPTLALVKNTDARVLFRGASSAFFLLSGSFAQKDPKTALVLSAAYMRAMNWMRKSNANLQQAALWATKDGAALSPRGAKLTTSQITEITRREILDVPAAPVIVSLPGRPPLKNEFDFLKKVGKIPRNSSFAALERAFAYDGLQQVLKSPLLYRLAEFEYRP